MINSVNFSCQNQANRLGNPPSVEKQQKTQAENIPFGNSYYQTYNPYYSEHPLKDKLFRLTNSVLGTIGFNAALWWLQDFVNGKVLVGKINKHFTNGIKNPEELMPLAFEMRQKEGLNNSVKISGGNKGEACFSHIGNEVIVGEDQLSSLFHEIGHAKIENKTEFLKLLQRNRGNYTILSLALYSLMSQKRHQSEDAFGDHKKSLGTKIKNFLSRSTLLVPLLAFSPELITEAKASQYGLKFLKEKVAQGKLDKNIYSKIKKSYATCFGTYLFIPISIILMELLFSGVEKEVQKQKRRSYIVTNY